jgi:hypothetical protein
MAQNILSWHVKLPYHFSFILQSSDFSPPRLPSNCRLKKRQEKQERKAHQTKIVVVKTEEALK